MAGEVGLGTPEGHRRRTPFRVLLITGSFKQNLIFFSQPFYMYMTYISFKLLPRIWLVLKIRLSP